MHQKTMKLKPLYGWNTSHTIMTLPEPNSAYKYPDGIVLTLKTSSNADHYFVERNFALQLANGIKESLFAKKGRPQSKPAENKPAKPQKKSNKGKPRAAKV